MQRHESPSAPFHLVRVGASVMPRSELIAALADIQQQVIDPTAHPRDDGDPVDTALVAMDAIAQKIVPPSPATGSRRAVAKSIVQRAARRLTAWYVEPRWHNQRLFDDASTRFGQTLAARTVVNRHELDDLRATVEHLRREVFILRRRLESQSCEDDTPTDVDS